MLSCLHFTVMLIASFGKYGTVEGDPYQLLEDKKSWVWILMFHVVHQKLTSRHITFMSSLKHGSENLYLCSKEIPISCVVSLRIT